MQALNSLSLHHVVLVVQLGRFQKTAYLTDWHDCAVVAKEQVISIELEPVVKFSFY